MPATKQTFGTMVQQVLQRTEVVRPGFGTVYAIDGDRIDVRIGISQTVLRHVEVDGAIDNLALGQEVSLRWEKNRPIATTTTQQSAASGAAGSGVIPDNVTIENSTSGLRVKDGGIGLRHLNFIPSIQGHRHFDDPMTKGGWQVSPGGVIWQASTFIHPTGLISLGSGDDVIKLDSWDDEWRFWAGNADPLLADFAVAVDGSIRATAGSIGGWTINETTLEHSNVILDPDGTITLGTGDTVAVMTSGSSAEWDEDWALWIGAADPDVAPFRVNKSGDAWLESAYISVDLQSDNYVSGQQGWKLDPTGRAEFQDAIIRGRLESAVYHQDKVSVIAGRMIVTDGDVLIADLAVSGSTIDVSSQVFETDDLLNIQPGGGRSEWMLVLDDGTSISGSGWRYEVTRGLNGSPQEFYAGEAIFRKGTATLPAPAPLWGDTEFGWGDMPFSSPFTSMGGFLTLEGSREFGPYFGVAIRTGAGYSQIADIARLGLLQGFLGIVGNEYGIGIGDLNRSLVYTYARGLEIKTSSNKTSIDDDGISSERFGLNFASEAPGYTDQMVRFWVDPATERIMLNYKDGTTEYEYVWFDFSAGGAIADDSDKLDGYHAAAFSLSGHTHGGVNANQLQGRDVAATEPNDGEILAWSASGSAWGPSASADGRFGGDSCLYEFDSSTTMGKPSDGHFRFNNASSALVTAMAINFWDAETIDQTGWLQSLDGYRARFFKLADPTKYGVYNLSGYTFHEEGYATFTLEHVSGTWSGDWSADDDIVMTVAPAGPYSGNATSIQGEAVSSTAPGDDYMWYYDVDTLEWTPTPGFDARKLQTRDVAADLPADNDVLKWSASGSTWAPAAEDTDATSLWGRNISSGDPVDGDVLQWVASGSAWTPVAPSLDATSLQGYAIDPSPPEEGYVLQWSISGSAWTPTEHSTDAESLWGNQVSPASPSDGDILVWSVSGSAWTPAAQSTDAHSLQDYDVGITEPQEGDVLTWSASGSAWNPAAPTAVPTISAQIFLSAAGGVPKTTGGCAAVAQSETATNDVNYRTLNFDATTEEYADFFFVLPSDYNGGVMTAKFIWTHGATTVNFGVVWGIKGRIYGDDDALDQAPGTAEVVTDTGGTTEDVYISAATDDITWGGTPAGNKLICVTVYRKAADGSDTLAVDAKLLGVQLTYTRT